MKITYTYHMFAPEHDMEVKVVFPRPDWWADATANQRTGMEAQALQSPEVKFALGAGYRMGNVTRPVCECIVQKVEHRDPSLRGARNTCKRCYGPLG